MTELVVVYYSNSHFDLEFDLAEVHEWWVKWDTLYVIHNEGEEAEEYEAEFSATQDDQMTKRPNRYFLDQVEVEKE